MQASTETDMADSVSIKPDPDEEKPTLAMVDEEMDEDAGDLEFYDKTAAGRQFETLYLARIPAYMFRAWMNIMDRLGDDDEVQIGTLRTWNQPELREDGTMGETTQLRMLLEPFAEHQGLPPEYTLDILDRDVRNNFVFTEQNLPSFEAKDKARAEAASAGIPASLLRQRGSRPGQEHGPQRQTYERRHRYQPYYRKAVPKKTKLFGKIHYEIRMEPKSSNDEELVLARSMSDFENSKSKLQIISRNSASSIMNPGSAVAAQWGGNFIKNAPQQAKPKKGEVLKAARIPKNKLLDLIFDCFRQYQYWSMKALRQKLEQPDSYLRQVLEEVAVLHKSGRFANHYGLSDAYKDKAGSDAKEEAAEVAEDGDEDEDEELEDVLPAQWERV